MTSTAIINQRQAQAVGDAFEVLEDLSASERLAEAKNEPLPPLEYTTSVLVAELSRVVAEQQKRIERLEAKQPRSTGKKKG